MIKSLRLRSTTVFYLLLKVLGILVALNFVSIGVDYYLQTIGKATFEQSYTLKTYVVLLFDFNAERNLPTYYNVFLLTVCAGFLLYISKVVKKQTSSAFCKHWYYLGCIFGFLALDELFMLHELLGTPFSSFLRSTFERQGLGFLYYAWVVPYIALVMFVGLYFFKFVFSLPKRIVINFIVAGSVFISGAVGMEMIEGYIADSVGEGGVYSNIYFKLCVALEETLEMLGLILFIRTLITFLATMEEPASLVVDIQFEGKERVNGFIPEASTAALAGQKMLDAVEPANER